MSEPTERRGLTALAQDAAELRAAYRDLPQQLASLRGFAYMFEAFIERLRPLVVRMDGQPWQARDEQTAHKVAEVDDLRLDLYSRLSTVLPLCRSPLDKLLYTSLRDPGPGIYELFGCKVFPEVDGFPVDAVSLARFDARVAEARAEINRQDLELDARIRRDGVRLHELEDAVPRLVLGSLRSLLWRNTWRRVVTTLSALLIASLVEPVRAALVWLWELARSRF